MKSVAVIKYNAGNVRSVLFALERLGMNPVLTDNHEEIRKAEKVIFPGVGEASTTMNYLKNKGLDTLIAGLQQPVLGICLGLQLLCRHSEEGNTNAIGVFDCAVKKFPTGPLKVPQIGWNKVVHQDNPLFKDIGDEYFYFVHSYYAELGKETVGITNYGIDFSSSIIRENFYAVQFHPEKSGEPGAVLLKNFLNF